MGTVSMKYISKVKVLIIVNGPVDNLVINSLLCVVKSHLLYCCKSNKSIGNVFTINNILLHKENEVAYPHQPPTQKKIKGNNIYYIF